MALLQGKAGKNLGFGDYLSTGVRSLFIWNFSLPVIRLGLIVGVIMQQAIGSIMVARFGNLRLEHLHGTRRGYASN